MQLWSILCQRINDIETLKTQHLDTVAQMTLYLVDMGSDITKIQRLFALLTDSVIYKYKLGFYAAENIFQNDCYLAVKYYDMESDDDIKLVYYQKAIEKFGNDISNNYFLLKCYRFCFTYFFQQKQYPESVECYLTQH